MCIICGQGRDSANNVQVVSDLVPEDKALANGQSYSGSTSEAPPAQLQLAAAWQVSPDPASASIRIWISACIPHCAR